MNDAQILIPLVVLVAICLTAAVVGVSVTRKKRRAARRQGLRQNLRLKLLYDEAKMDRLIDFERQELKRKGRTQESVEDLMERAIARWERENAGTAALY
jgi:hypothetical protein